VWEVYAPHDRLESWLGPHPRLTPGDHTDRARAESAQSRVRSGVFAVRLGIRHRQARITFDYRGIYHDVINSVRPAAAFITCVVPVRRAASVIRWWPCGRADPPALLFVTSSRCGRHTGVEARA
jgi:hypothetical protein